MLGADACATSATTSALCPAATEDSSESFCPLLALDVTCSLLAGEASSLLAVLPR